MNALTYFNACTLHPKSISWYIALMRFIERTQILKSRGDYFGQKERSWCKETCMSIISCIYDFNLKTRWTDRSFYCIMSGERVWFFKRLIVVVHFIKQQDIKLTSCCVQHRAKGEVCNNEDHKVDWLSH